LLSRFRHSRRSLVRRHHRSPSLFLRPFAPRALPRFDATMDALTPRRLPLSPGSPCFLRDAFPPFCRQPPNESCARFSTLPFSGAGFHALPRAVRASSFSSRLAISSSRIAFIILRTGGSTPVALHPASRRRSYSCLQAGERVPEPDLHRSDIAPLQAHWHHPRGGDLLLVG
jgi:hypothetical protein